MELVCRILSQIPFDIKSDQICFWIWKGGFVGGDHYIPYDQRARCLTLADRLIEGVPFIYTAEQRLILCYRHKISHSFCPEYAVSTFKSVNNSKSYVCASQHHKEKSDFTVKLTGCPKITPRKPASERR